MRNGVAVVLIVRDEERVLARCLESVAGVEQIVVLDTGSQDRTIEIARGFTDDVHTMEPIVPFHFAEARNRALEHAKEDWILTLDADEVLAGGALNHIRRATWREPKAAGFNLNFVLFDEEGKNPTRLPKLKLFRRGAWVWQYRIHEILQPRAPDLIVKPMLQASIEHRPVPKIGARVGQNEELLKLAVLENPEYIRNIRQLGMELYARGEYEQALPHFERYLGTNAVERLDRSETLVHVALCHGMAERYHESIEKFEEAEKVAPERREILYHKGVVFMKGRSPEQAIEAFEKCLTIPVESKPDFHLNVDSIWEGTPVREAIVHCRKVADEAKAAWLAQQQGKTPKEKA